ncbi:MAG: phage major capsid protein [Clostridiales bacterium]|nr:phage major capsid protein [Clostridiales bacterium]
MVTLETADSALKTVYLGVVGNQLNINANPLLTKIKQTSNNVYGNEIRKATSFGISGGVSAGAEDGALPTAFAKGRQHFEATLKNLYGTIEITDKAIRCSQNNAGAFVNLLNDEMESLIKSSTFNLGRMLYGDGSGILGTINSNTSMDDEYLPIDNIRNLVTNLGFRFVNAAGSAYIDNKEYYVRHVDKAAKKFSYSAYAEDDYKNKKIATLNGLNNEITGLGKIFGDGDTLYGISKTANKWMNPYKQASVGAISETAIQTAIDEIEEASGSEVDFIACSTKVRRAYQEVMSSYKRNIDVMNLQGGFKALSYNGIPVVADRFVEDDAMYILSTKDFELCQLCDWQWLEGNDGKIIKQKEGYPVFTATLVKYAELLCNRPNAQAKLSGITGA